MCKWFRLRRISKHCAAARASFGSMCRQLCLPACAQWAVNQCTGPGVAFKHKHFLHVTSYLVQKTHVFQSNECSPVIQGTHTCLLCFLRRHRQVSWETMQLLILLILSPVASESPLHQHSSQTQSKCEPSQSHTSASALVHMQQQACPQANRQSV